MRAKYVKKQWYQEPNGSAAPTEPHISHTPSTSSNSPIVNDVSGVFAVPSRVRAISNSQSVDILVRRQHVLAQG